jgi:spermidine/putrescine transport system substrate-binding protein
MTNDRRSLTNLESLAFARGLTRRDLLRRAGMAGGTLMGANLLAACGGGGTVGGAQSTSQSTAALDKTVASNWVFSNWEDYIDVDKNGSYPTLKAFDKATGTHTKYLDADIPDNEAFFGKVQGQLSAGQSIGRDIVVLTDWMAGKWIELGYAEKLDKSVIPNVEANQLKTLRGRPIDPKDEYLVPWQSGMTGIGYNIKKTGRELTSIKDLWDPKFKGKVTLLTESRDTVGLVMLNQGVDPAHATLDQMKAAIDEIQTYVDNDQVRGFTGNEYVKPLVAGDTWACMAWSGDVAQEVVSNKDLRWILPEDGGMIWTDNMLIPAHADAPYNAHLWMDYCYRPEVAATIEDYINYICPVDGAREVLLGSDPAIAENTLIFPTDEMLAKTHAFVSLSVDDDTTFSGMFQKLIGA